MADNDSSTAESETPTASQESGDAPETGAGDSTASTGETPEAQQGDGSGETPTDDSPNLDALKSALAKERELRKQREQDLARLKAEQERKALITKIAQEQSLPPVLAERLQGTTEEELKADAERLAKSLPTPVAPPPPTPVGGPQGTPSTERTPEDWIKFLRASR